MRNSIIFKRSFGSIKEKGKETIETIKKVLTGVEEKIKDSSEEVLKKGKNKLEHSEAEIDEETEKLKNKGISKKNKTTIVLI
jgi:hypothetical protein